MRKGFGYTTVVIERNKAADARSHIGVKLGRACIKTGTPVLTVAADFNVTPQTVYNWFCGRTAPAGRYHTDIKEYISWLKTNQKQAA